jgi:hypothetical protein
VSESQKVLTKMCRVCLDSYEMPRQGIMIFDDGCHCCQRIHVTVYCISGEQIDNFNEQEEKRNEKSVSKKRN